MLNEDGQRRMAQGIADGIRRSVGTQSSRPAAPSNPRATAISSSQIRIDWQDNSNNENGFHLYGVPNSSTLVGTTGAGATSFTHGGLQPNTWYCYFVKAFNGAGESDWSGWACTTTLPQPSTSKPAAPSNPRATAISPTQIRIDWQDNSTNESGFRLYGVPNSSTVVGTTGANATSFTHGGLTPNTWYCYFVKAFNSAGESDWSGWACTTTLNQSDPKPAAPSNLAATAAGAAITIIWRDNSSNETGFIVRRWNGSNWSEIGRVGANVTWFVNSGLSSNTTYYYIVSAYNAAGDVWAGNYTWATTPTGSTTNRTEVLVDDRDGGFTKGGRYWWESTIGHNGHMYWTYVNGWTVDSWGEWRANLAGGRYEVFVFVPRDNATTRNAVYQIFHQGGTSNRSVNQNIYYDQWISVGTYDFAAGTDRRVRLTDATGESGGTSYKVGFDAVKFVPR